MGSASN